MMDGTLEKIGGRDKVGVENGDEFARGGGHAGGKGARFVAGAIGAVA